MLIFDYPCNAQCPPGGHRGFAHIETMMYLSYINLTYGILLTLMREMNDRNDIFANTFEVN